MNFTKIALFAIAVPAATIFCFGNEKPVPAEKSVQAQPAALAELPLAGLPKIWLQGEAIKAWKKDCVYVFEFWATWCGPCLQAMPHVEAIHEKVLAEKINAQIVGINVFDSVPAEKLKKFLEKRPIRPTYTMGVDSKDSRKTQKYWLNPLGVKGIPHAVAVKNGKILWQGHPQNLSFELIKTMTAENFSPESLEKKAAQKANEKTWAENERKKIFELFSNNKIDEAKALRKQFIEDKRPSNALKIETYELAVNIFYAQEKFEAFNQELAALAEAFPKERQAQFAVIRDVLDGDDVPEKMRNYALAEQCARRLIELDAANGNPQALPFELLSRVQEAKGDLQAAIAAQEKALEYSSAKRELDNLQKKLPAGTKSTFDVTLLDTKTAQKSFPEKGETLASKTENATALVAFLKSLSWAQGGAPATLPENKTVFIELWHPPMGGGIISGMMRSRAPARWCRAKLASLPNAQIFAIVPANEPAKSIERTKKMLQKSYFKTTVPVAIAGADDVAKVLMTPNGIKESPAAFAIRDGECIWAGNPQDMPEWLVETALDGSYKNSEGKLLREREAEKQKAAWAAFKDARNLMGKNKFDEANSLLEKWMPEFKKSSGIAAFVYELQMGEPFAKKDFTKIGKLSDELLTLFPNDNFIGERELEILTSNPELKEATFPTIERAVKQMLRTRRGNANYTSRVLSILSEILVEEKKFDEALGAAEAAYKNSPENATLTRLREAAFPKK